MKHGVTEMRDDIETLRAELQELKLENAQQNKILALHQANVELMNTRMEQLRRTLESVCSAILQMTIPAAEPGKPTSESN